MGGREAGEMQFGTKDEYLRFSEAISDGPLAFCAFEVTEPKTRKPVRTIKMPARRRGEGPQVRCAGDEDNQRQFDEKDIYYFHQKGGAL